MVTHLLSSILPSYDFFIPRIYILMHHWEGQFWEGDECYWNQEAVTSVTP